MTCEVKIIQDSINPYNDIRLTTLQVRYWRAIHAELMTHRVFSRNASSSRAIPISTILKQVWNDPAGPIHWGANQSGMKAWVELTGIKKKFAQFMWRFIGKIVCILVWITNKLVSPHKQIFNRILEPWSYISVIITSTEWANFFELRDHPDAQPEIQELARMMKIAMDASRPESIAQGEWHLPYITSEEKTIYSQEELLKASTARCARVSYSNHDGSIPNIAKDIDLHDKLVGSEPRHSSPAEHQATPGEPDYWYKNFKGWIQYRVYIEDENDIYNKRRK